MGLRCGSAKTLLEATSLRCHWKNPVLGRYRRGVTENPRKCTSCGGSNPVGMKFCGMCGAALAVAPADRSAENVLASGHPGIDDAVEPEPVPLPTRATSTPAPAHTGGAFRLMGQDVDPGGRSLDYLLEDDEESGSGRGAWVLALVVALALAGGLGYWRYQNGSWAGGRTAGNAAHEAPPAGNAASSDNTVSAPDGGGAAPENNGAASTAPPAQSPQAAALTEVHPQNPAAPIASPQDPAQSAAPTATPAARAAKPTGLDHTATPSKPAARAEPPVKAAEDPVTLGEKYIYGRGVPQSCERGLKMVKPAADQANGKAMITMGALYATGHCVTRDLPTAYRYFALALRKDPENGALKENAQMVWGQMTQSERQQAIRLTQ